MDTYVLYWFLKHKVGKKFASLICCTLPPAFFFYLSSLVMELKRTRCIHSKGCDSWTSQDVINDYTLKLIESLSQTYSHLESFTSINDFSWKLC